MSNILIREYKEKTFCDRCKKSSDDAEVMIIMDVRVMNFVNNLDAFFTQKEESKHKKLQKILSDRFELCLKCMLEFTTYSEEPKA